MKIILGYLVQFIATVFAAEFAAGFVHWLEDAYIRDHTPVLGRLVGRPNTVHHHYPRYMARHNWWETSWNLLVLAGILIVGAWCLGLLTWHVWLFAFLATNANEIHKWEHRTRKENGRIISFFQDIHILQSPKHHAKHHTDPKNDHYCTITNFMNPVLDKIRFWDGLEWLLAKTIGLKRQPDTSVRGHGPGPVWLKEFAPISPGAGRSSSAATSYQSSHQNQSEPAMFKEVAAAGTAALRAANGPINLNNVP